jgi:hypothetical protein
MRGRSHRLWRVIFWVAIGLCTSIAGLGTMSLRGGIWYVPEDRSYMGAVAHGELGFVRVDNPSHIYRVSGYYLSKEELFVFWWPEYARAKGMWSVHIPLWLIALPPAVVSGYAWRRSRRVPAGHCLKYGYSLAGLAAGALCPECGKTLRGERTMGGA